MDGSLNTDPNVRVVQDRKPIRPRLLFALPAYDLRSLERFRAVEKESREISINDLENDRVKFLVSLERDGHNGLFASRNLVQHLGIIKINRARQFTPDED